MPELPLTLEAILRGDGWAFVRQGEQRWVVEPPYGPDRRHPVTRDDVERALHGMGFEVAEGELADWAALARFLRAEQVRAADPERLQRVEEAARRMVAHADARDLRLRLDRVEQALDTRRAWREAQVILSVAIESPGAGEDTALRQRISRLLQRCIEEQRHQETLRAGLRQPSPSRQAWLKPAYDRYGQDNLDRVSDEIARAGQVLPAGELAG